MACRSSFLLGWLLLAATATAAESAAGAGTDAPGPRIPQLGWRLDGDAFLRFGQGLGTPHTKWANPSAQGRIKALFIANRNDAYDIPELARRLDLEVHGMPAETWFRMGEWYWLAMWLEGSAGSERQAHLERMLDDGYDVIVLANFRLASLPDAIQCRVLEKVANGCGLAMFHRHDLDPRLLRQALPDVPERLARGIPFAGLDFYRNWFMPSRDLVTPDQIGVALLRAYTFGRGRVLIAECNVQSSVFAAAPGGLTPSMDYDYTAGVRYDYHQSLAARCVQWAAGRDPVLVWTGAFPDGTEVPALRESPPVRVEAAWTGPEDTSLTRKTRVRNLWGEVLHESEAVDRAKAGPLAWNVPLPPLPGGWHFVDVIVSSPRGVENWGSFSVDVRPASRIDAIEPAAGFFEADQPITGRVVLSKAPAADERASLEVTLEDGYGRVFSRISKAIEPGADRVLFEIPQGQAVSWGARLRVRLLAGGRAVHQDEAEVRVRRPSRGEYPIAMWGAISGYGNHIGNLQMRKLGFTAVIGEPLAEARDDLGSMVFGGGQGALIHSLGDEIPVPRPGRGEALAGFLKKRYASLDELNAAWGTACDSWYAVEPAYTVTDGRPGSFVRMHDSRSCGEFLFADNIRKQREKIEKANPPGVVGPEGSPVGDPELTLPEATFWGPYLADRDNLLVNALGRPGVLRGNWFGGYVEDRQIPTRNRHRLWLSILGGNNMIEYFTIGGGLLAPDLTLMPFVEEFLPAWREIRRGLGPQLAACRPAGNPVALLHSQPSEHIGGAGGGATDTVEGHEYVLNLLGDAGYSPQYVASGQVKAGRLRQGDVRVLFLVQAFALSDAEIAEIVAFADRGGTVVADIPPAWFDDRCRLRKTRAMDGFFGVRAPAASLRPHVERMGTAAKVETADGLMLLRGIDADVRSADAESPAMPHVRRHGQGRSILLNGVLWKEGREDLPTIRAFRGMLERATGVRPEFEVAWTQPLPVWDRFAASREPLLAATRPSQSPRIAVGAKVYSYRRGAIRIDAVLPPEATDPAAPVRPKLTWPEARHTYDLRRERYLGNLAELEQEVERSSPVVVARLTYKVGRVRIEAPKGAGVGGTLKMTCTVEDADGKPRRGHVIRIEVFGPEGKERPYYGGWCTAEGPTQSWRIPFAMNDAPGAWKIVATDVISGTRGEAAVELAR